MNPLHKIRLLTVVKCLLIPVGVLVSFFRERPPILILMYHRVNDAIWKEISVKKQDFRWQMNYLRKKGYQVIPLSQAMQTGLWSKGGNEKQSRKKPLAVLTFDDGYQDFYTTVHPILSVYHYPSIVYLVPGAMDTGQVFWWDQDLGKSDLMGWKEVKELAEHPLVTFGSHTMTHPDLNRLSPQEIDQELSQSKNRLEQELSQEIRHFAYPRGIVTNEAKESARNHYDTALSIFDGADLPLSRYRIRRMPIQRSDGRILFGARLKGWLVAEEWIKSCLGRQ